MSFLHDVPHISLMIMKKAIEVKNLIYLTFIKQRLVVLDKMLEIRLNIHFLQVLVVH